jgi:AcrR family transcriptional regulator
VPYRPTERTEARKAATRDAILTAAVDQLAAGGYASASIGAVAARAGVATGTVYRHFESKSALFAEAFRVAARRELDAFAHLAVDDGRGAGERIGAALETWARRALAEPKRAYALLASRSTRPSRPNAWSSGAATATCWPRRCSRASTAASSHHTTRRPSAPP